MKKLLQLSLLLVAAFCFGQPPAVQNPNLALATDFSLAITAQITPFANGSWTVAVSEDAFFTPNVTIEYNSGSISGTAPIVVSATIPCLLSGRNYYVRVRATTVAGTTTSNYTLMATTGSNFNNLPKINTSTVSNLATTSATIDLNIDNNTNVPTTGTLFYGLSPTTMNSTANISQTSTDNANTSVNLNSLNPNTTYFARIYLTNSVGCTNSTIFQFTTNQIVTLLYHFLFNGNTSTNIVNAGTFTSTGGSGTFVSDGLGNATGALAVDVNSTNIASAKWTANLPSLPVGTTSRSIAMRLNFRNTTPLEHFVVSWGTSTNNQSYGYQKTDTQGRSAVWGNNVNFNDATVANTWVNVVIAYDSNTQQVTYYKNGALIAPIPTQGNVNTVGTNIVLGSSLAANFGFAKFDIDDLKIYSGVLSSAQVTALANENFQTNNLKFSMFPNPATNLLNIELEKDLQSLEIYSLQGQKVLTGSEKQINISGLSAGMYMVRVQDVDGGVATQKLIKE
jgi:hypothetical protein